MPLPRYVVVYRKGLRPKIERLLKLNPALRGSIDQAAETFDRRVAFRPETKGHPAQLPGLPQNARYYRIGPVVFFFRADRARRIVEVVDIVLVPPSTTGNGFMPLQ